MDFLDFDAMLPFYVDYLGTFERDVDGIADATDVLKDLVDHGVQVTTHNLSPGSILQLLNLQLQRHHCG
jgi:hypothetical protein